MDFVRVLSWEFVDRSLCGKEDDPRKHTNQTRTKSTSIERDPTVGQTRVEQLMLRGRSMTGFRPSFDATMSRLFLTARFILPTPPALHPTT